MGETRCWKKKESRILCKKIPPHLFLSHLTREERGGEEENVCAYLVSSVVKRLLVGWGVEGSGGILLAEEEALCIGRHQIFFFFSEHGKKALDFPIGKKSPFLSRQFFHGRPGASNVFTHNSPSFQDPLLVLFIWSEFSRRTWWMDTEPPSPPPF